MSEPVGVAAHNNATALVLSHSLPQVLFERFKDYGQEYVFAHWDELSPDERNLLIKDIESIDISRIDRIIRCSLRSQGLPVATIEPVPEAMVDVRTFEERERDGGRWA